MEHVLEVEPTQMSMCKTEQSGPLCLKKGMAATSRAFPGFLIQFSQVQPPHLSDYLHGTPRTKVKNPPLEDIRKWATQEAGKPA